MSTEEIIEALRKCVSDEYCCEECPYNSDCSQLLRDTLKVIDKQILKDGE